MLTCGVPFPPYTKLVTLHDVLRTTCQPLHTYEAVTACGHHNVNALLKFTPKLTCNLLPYIINMIFVGKFA